MEGRIGRRRYERACSRPGKERGSWVIKYFKKETEGQVSKMGWVIKKFKKRVEGRSK